MVDDAACIDSEDIEGTAKPFTIENCSLADVPDCRPRWHISEWTEVSTQFVDLYNNIYFLKVV